MITTIDPATGSAIATYRVHDWDDVDLALAQASQAFTFWSSVPVEKRADLLRRLGGLLLERRESCAALITAEMGKPLAEALAEVDKCAGNCEVVADHAAEWLRDKQVLARSWVSYEPLGSCSR